MISASRTVEDSSGLHKRLVAFDARVKMVGSSARMLQRAKTKLRKEFGK
jgi:hypothetical protein